MTPDQKTALLSALDAIPNRFHTETRLHDAVLDVMRTAHRNHGGFSGEPEHRLDNRDRIDFLVTGYHDGEPDPASRIGIECKVKGSAASILRQLYRYAEHLPELVLVSARATGIQPGTLTAANGNKCILHVFELWKNPT